VSLASGPGERDQRAIDMQNYAGRRPWFDLRCRRALRLLVFLDMSAASPSNELI
jgi:hypothetical protein